MLTLISLLLALGPAGCSRGPKLAPVKGTVTLKGRPLDNIMIEFIPDAPIGLRSTATTNEQGQHTLVCDDKRPGAIVGPHRVVLHDLGVYGGKFWGRKLENAGPKDGLKAPRISDRYATAGQTPLQKEVKPEAQTIDLEVMGP
jgi:hypothetical protein